MSRRRIHLDGEGRYRPEERVTGRVEGEQVVGEVRLFWRTCGRGTDELGVVAVEPVTSDGRFTLTLPRAPYSTDGSLVSIAWGIEWVDDEGDALDQREITMSPTGEEIRLKAIREPRSQKKKRWWNQSS